MLIFALDDEPAMLAELHDAAAEAMPEAEIMDFMRAEKALEAMDGGKLPDLVFSDVEMPGMDGLSFAVQIKNRAPGAKIVFVTGFSQYALEAYRRHVSGYLLKPVDADMIREELAALGLNADASQTDRLRVRCFGHFEVFWRDRPLTFARSRTKELFAYLVDREGAFCTAGEIINALWEDGEEGKDAKTYLRVLTNDLSVALGAVGMRDALLKRRGQWAVDCGRLDCDYYRMLSGDMDAVNAYQGQYMIDYSWAELTGARLHFRKVTKI